MAKKVVVHAVVNKEPDVRLYVLALIELARQLQAQQVEEEKEAAGSVEVGGVA